MLSRFFCCLRMILQKFDRFYTFSTRGILDFQKQQINASRYGCGHRQICSPPRYSQIIVYWGRSLGYVCNLCLPRCHGSVTGTPASWPSTSSSTPPATGSRWSPCLRAESCHDRLSPRSRMPRTLTSGGWCSNRWRSPTRAGTAARSATLLSGLGLAVLGIHWKSFVSLAILLTRTDSWGQGCQTLCIPCRLSREIHC